MAAHARTAILAAFKAAFAALPSLPTIFDHAALPVPIESLPSVSIVPGGEETDSESHEATFPTLRKLTVRVVCSAKTRARADEIAREVEVAAPYETAGLGAHYAGSDFAEEARAESLIFQTRVNFTVLYEAGAS